MFVHQIFECLLHAGCLLGVLMDERTNSQRAPSEFGSSRHIKAFECCTRKPRNWGASVLDEVLGGEWTVSGMASKEGTVHTQELKDGARLGIHESVPFWAKCCIHTSARKTPAPVPYFWVFSRNLSLGSWLYISETDVFFWLCLRIKYKVWPQNPIFAGSGLIAHQVDFKVVGGLLLCEANKSDEISSDIASIYSSVLSWLQQI